MELEIPTKEFLASRGKVFSLRKLAERFIGYEEETAYRPSTHWVWWPNGKVQVDTERLGYRATWLNGYQLVNCTTEDGLIRAPSFQRGDNGLPIYSLYRAERVMELYLHEGRELFVLDRYHSNGKIRDRTYIKVSEDILEVPFWYEGHNRIHISVRGCRHGPMTKWHPNGQKKLECHFNGGLLAKSMTEWYPSGKKKSVKHFADGMLHGETRTWHMNGVLEGRTSHAFGLQEGPTEHYDPKGNLILQCRFYRNNLVGLYRMWDSDGSLKKKCFYAQYDSKSKKSDPGDGPIKT